MRIAIVNQFAPPDEPPTSVLAGELATHLEADGHEVCLIACDSGYRQRKARRGRRLLRELRAHLSLFWQCLRLRRADVLIALSSPACLPATVCFAARLKRCRFVHWAMDVYPDVAVVLDEIRNHGIVHKLTKCAMRRAYRRANPLVALTVDMAKVLGGQPEICPPWAPASLQWPTSIPSSSTPFTWLYSGNLGRAHLYRPLLLAQQKLEQNEVPARLVFQGGGPSIAQATALAEELGLKNCEFRDYAARDQLLASLFAADVLVATQKPETGGLLWPSKLAVMKHVPRPLLWIGPDPSVEASIFVPDDIDGIAAWIEQQVSSPAHIPYTPPSPPIESLERWSEWIGKS